MPIDTRERLLTTAERLFAERGIAAVSLRQIGAEAGQRNNSAAQYHFESKEGLIEAILAHRMRALNARRIAMLEASEGDLDLRAAVEALVYPFAECLDDPEGGSTYVRFLAQVYSDPNLNTHTLHALGDDSMEGNRRVAERILACLDVPPRLGTTRILLAAGLIIHAMADRERQIAAGHTPVPSSTSLFTADLVDAVVGLLSARPSPQTLREEHATPPKRRA